MTAACALVAATSSASAPAAAAPSTDAVAEAYFLFLQSRRLEQTGNVEGAVGALRRAATLLPRMAEIQAELSARVRARGPRRRRRLPPERPRWRIDGIES